MTKPKTRLDPDEARGRRLLRAMESCYNWRQLTGRQLEQVLSMAEEFHSFMRRARSERMSNP